MDSLYGMMIIFGPLLLGAVLLYAILSNRRKRSAADLAQTERGTRKLHDELDREDKAREQGRVAAKSGENPDVAPEAADRTSISAPNISTGYQPVGGARHLRDTLDREPKRDPMSGGAIPDNYDPATTKRVDVGRTGADVGAARVAKPGRTNP